MELLLLLLLLEELEEDDPLLLLLLLLLLLEEEDSFTVGVASCGSSIKVSCGSAIKARVSFASSRSKGVSSEELPSLLIDDESLEELLLLLLLPDVFLKKWETRFGPVRLLSSSDFVQVIKVARPMRSAATPRTTMIPLRDEYNPFDRFFGLNTSPLPSA